MSVILPDDARNAWLDRATRYKKLLEPDAATLELVQVSPLVNSVKNDSEGLRGRDTRTELRITDVRTRELKLATKFNNTQE